MKHYEIFLQKEISFKFLTKFNVSHTPGYNIKTLKLINNT